MRKKLALFALAASLSPGFVNIVDSAPTIVVFESARAQSDSRGGMEPYSVRPSILEVEPKLLKEQSGVSKKVWDALKRAQFAAAIELLFLYPDHDLYFLGRDAEMIFDAAQLLAGEEARRRLHLINISRANVRTSELLDYLADNGISKEEFARGRRIVFFDTGFAGTIPKKIVEFFPEFKDRIKTHLIISGTHEFPSTRSFLIELNPGVNEAALAQLHGTITIYEHFPRYTDRSTKFAEVNGKWEAMSPKSGDEMDGSVNKELSLGFMQDLKYSFQNDPELREFIRSLKEHWKELGEIISKNEKRPGDLRSALIRFLSVESGLDGSRKEALVRDLFDARLSGAKLARALKDLELEDLGLRAQPKSREMLALEVLKKNPHWADIMVEPEKEIPKAIAARDFQTLGAIADLVDDLEFFKTLIRNLDSEPWSQNKGALFRALLEKNNPYVNRLIADESLKHVPVAFVRDVVKFLIQFDRELLPNLFENLFAQARWAEMTEILMTLYERANANERKIMGLTSAKLLSPDRARFVTLLLELRDPNFVVEFARLFDLRMDQYPEVWEKLLEVMDRKDVLDAILLEVEEPIREMILSRLRGGSRLMCRDLFKSAI